MRKLKIEYFPQKCIGNGNCIKEAPAYFREKDGITVLQGAREEQQRQILEKEFPDAEEIIRAAISCPVNAIKVTDSMTGDVLVSVAVKEQGVREMKAVYDDQKEFVLDPEGYFLIRVNPEKNLIEVGFCTMRNEVVLKVTGTTPLEIYQTIINKAGLNLRKDHCAYLGRELQKAFIALRAGLPYVQDDELAIYSGGLK